MSTCSRRKKLERRHHGHWLRLCGGQPPSARYWRHHAAEIVLLDASTPCHRAGLQSCKLVASAVTWRHNEVAARDEIAVDVGASTPHVIGAGSRPKKAGVREREPRRDCKDCKIRDGRDFQEVYAHASISKFFFSSPSRDSYSPRTGSTRSFQRYPDLSPAPTRSQITRHPLVCGDP